VRNRFSSKVTIDAAGRPLTRDVAPEEFRAVVVTFPLGVQGVYVNGTREALCRGLKRLPDRQNWSKENVVREVHSLIEDAEWYQVYDASEAIADELLRRNLREEYDDYEAEINRTLEECSVGWRMVEARFQVRGDEAVQGVLDSALQDVCESGLAVASKEMRESIDDLSKRPAPDLSGAVHHALASLESIARHCTGDPQSSLGEIVKKHPGLLGEPLNTTVAKLWGYSSEQARHGRENRRLDPDEAELAVGAAIVIASFLVRRLTT
jgi:hypothetical protein